MLRAEGGLPGEVSASLGTILPSGSIPGHHLASWSHGRPQPFFPILYLHHLMSFPHLKLFPRLPLALLMEVRS